MAEPETIQQPSSAAWDRTTRPSAVWAEIVRGASTDEERACIAAATRQADRVWVALHTPRLLRLAATITTGSGQAAGVIPARNRDWHRLALSAYEVLRSSAAYGHLAQLRPHNCAAVEPVLQQWLNSRAPTRHSDEHTEAPSVAQRLGIADEVHRINGDTLAAHLSTVINAAQDAGVFGLAGHRVELVTAPSTHHTGTHVRVVVDTPHGLALASKPMPLAALIAPDSRGVAATTAALRRIADVATALFHDHARAVWHHPPPNPVPDQAATPTTRAFPQLRLEQRAAPPVPPIPTGPTTAARMTVDESHTGRPR